jgi:hypothetical protein
VLFFCQDGSEPFWTWARRMILMSTPVIRLLVLTNGLLLALPPGWCAALPIHRTKSPPPKVNCCCSCKPPSPSERPDPKPSPRQPLQICCCRGDLVVPPTLKIAVRDMAFAAVLDAPDDSGCHQGTAFADGLVGRFLPPPLHVLNCSWRC